MLDAKSGCKIFAVFFVLISLELANADVRIVSRSEWNAQEAKEELTRLELPIPRVIVAHTAGADCNDADTCAQQVRNIQQFQMNSLHFDDIAYNFLIGNDGNVYAGRGWEFQGALAKGYNAGSIGITFVGTYEKSVPSEKALEAATSLLELGVNTGKLTNDYKLFGHRQLSATNSPGAALYEIVKQWPHWSRQV